MSSKTIPLEDQLREMDKYFPYVLIDLLIDLSVLASRKEFVAERMVQGYEEFGDSGFRKPRKDLDSEIMEELADAMIYKLMQGSDLGRK